MNLQSSDFELFGLPESFAIDRAALDARWKDLQRHAHPDRNAHADPATQRQAMQWSVRINEAYQRLKDPLRRAAYLCERRGAPIEAENNTAMPADFLMQQMQWRESLDETEGVAALEALADEVAEARRARIEALRAALDERGDAPEAARQVRALMFIERFASDVEDRLDQRGQ
ncbi:MAG: Fe-S protein assembly co-chaperone HscB [Comamonadaceae bacterium]|jgi:molecular chaperone HscB|uniref:Co-chaperone protein HscB homolog n=1 Tax=Hydrogenophaga borbori TaxID=2294117 RepID=A0A372EFK0_9BURK|nr:MULTISPECIES: Fe-S protein assembly co-chaperone HscB [Hydrogenophaga]NCT98760.1 Fe-S protein assembly co-chaperone HscB [Comamonadaceae bacterium]RFP77211.1 Fe-S protein assembly co-chaperone HscB [Hydrogenophaga borbori]WQB82354.1 Fe-S protein assembly co-chaperone HscB [Hydrogenophaga sp. SNF1]